MTSEPSVQLTLKAGPSGPYYNGNGVLMRMLPLALWHLGNDAALVADAQAQSCVTHGHLRSQVCGALYALWARRVLQEIASPWEDAVQTLRVLYATNPPATEELEWSVRLEVREQGTGSGYVVDCLRSALWATEQGDYEAVVRAAICLGRDTDTTACVAGGIAGLRDGLESIPLRWREQLQGRELLDPLLEKLLAHKRNSNI